MIGQKFQNFFWRFFWHFWVKNYIFWPFSIFIGLQEKSVFYKSDSEFRSGYFELSLRSVAWKIADFKIFLKNFLGTFGVKNHVFGHFSIFLGLQEKSVFYKSDSEFCSGHFELSWRSVAWKIAENELAVFRLGISGPILTRLTAQYVIFNAKKWTWSGEYCPNIYNYWVNTPLSIENSRRIKIWKICSGAFSKISTDLRTYRIHRHTQIRECMYLNIGSLEFKNFNS